MSITISAAIPTGEVIFFPEVIDNGTVYPAQEVAKTEFVLEVNMCNSNARAILSRLGVTGDDLYCGSMEPALFAERLSFARIANGVFDETADGGTDAFENGRFYEGSRPEGYFADKFDRLDEIVQAAVEHPNGKVQWG